MELRGPGVESGDSERADRPVINKFKLNIQTNAAIVDIQVWAAREEAGECSAVQSYSTGTLSSQRRTC